MLYSLEFRELTDVSVRLTEHEVTNKITFSALHAVHGLQVPGCLPKEPASKFLAASEDFARSNTFFEILSATFEQSVI